MTTQYPHRIRLRGPWEYHTSSGTGRLTLPAALAETSLAGHVGEVVFLRRFGYPGRIDEGEVVWLMLSGCAAPAVTVLNGVPLGVCKVEGEWDITRQLRPRNVLEVRTIATSAMPWHEVAMEVRRTAYLRGLSAAIEGGRLRVSGSVVGISDGPLDLYVVANRRTWAYTTLQAAQPGTPFTLLSEEECVVHEPVCVELVQGATVWYSATVEVGHGEGEKDGDSVA